MKARPSGQLASGKFYAQFESLGALEFNLRPKSILGVYMGKIEIEMVKGRSKKV